MAEPEGQHQKIEILKNNVKEAVDTHRQTMLEPGRRIQAAVHLRPNSVVRVKARLLDAQESVQRCAQAGGHGFGLQLLLEQLDQSLTAIDWSRLYYL